MSTKQPPKGDFIRGAYSFRRGIYLGSNNDQRPHWDIYPKGRRFGSMSARAQIHQASDGATYSVSGDGHAYDARPNFESAVALVLEWLAPSNGGANA